MINLSVFLFLAARVSGPELPPEQRTALVAALTQAIDRKDLASVSVAVLSKGDVVFSGSCGMADQENKLPADADTIYNLASLTKPFTATAILRLYDQHKLSLEDKIGKFLPDAPTPWRSITIRQILTHSSGILDYTKFKNPLIEVGKDYTPGEVLKKAYSYPLEFEPGSRSVYSNMGFVVLGHIIAKASGMSYRDYMKRNLFAPLGMEHSYIGAAGVRAPQNFAKPYIPDGAKFAAAPYISLNWSLSAGGMMTSLRDLCAWDKVVDRQSFLNPGTWSLAWAPTVTLAEPHVPYGLGWIVTKLAGERVICHLGGKPGYSAMYSRFPDKRMSIIVLSNGSGSKAYGLSQKVYSILSSK